MTYSEIIAYKLEIWKTIFYGTRDSTSVYQPNEAAVKANEIFTTLTTK